MIKLCNIERFATHDGPGIRTVIFFQGCPLRCPWCANPESQPIGPHLLYNRKSCVKCHTCETHCPTNAITFINNQFHWDETKCQHCHTCKNMCLQNAISFSSEEKAVEEIMQVVRKDNAYYKTSHGGVTISGGEAFQQFDGFMELLQACKKEHYHVTIETCGQYPIDLLKKAYPYIDLFYFDVKHIQSKIYKKVIHGDLSQVKQNMNYLIAQNPSSIVFRVPVIVNFNDDDATLTAIIDLAQQNHIKEVHFLPYHTLGKIKYEKMMKDYNWSSTMMKEEALYPYLTYAKSKGVILKIGG